MGVLQKVFVSTSSKLRYWYLLHLFKNYGTTLVSRSYCCSKRSWTTYLRSPYTHSSSRGMGRVDSLLRIGCFRSLGSNLEPYMAARYIRPTVYNSSRNHSILGWLDD